MRHHIATIISIVLAFVFGSCIDDFNWGAMNKAQESKDSYLSFTLNMPEGDGATRAEGDQPGDQNDNNATLNHGTAKEYEIYNAYLLLFQGDTDNQFGATFIKCYQIYDKTQTVPPGQITHVSSRYIIRNLALWDFVPTEGKHYFGVILANIDAPDAIRPNIIKHKVSFRVGDGSSYQDIAGYSYERFKQDIMLPMSSLDQGRNFLSINREGNTYLMMSNAMLFPIEQGDGYLYKGILEAVDLTGKIKPKPVASNADYDPNWPSFYLERLAAKVEVTDGTPSTKTLTIGGTTYHYQLNRWCIANVSPNNFVMRHGDMQWDVLRSKSSDVADINRFTSNSHIESTSTPNNQGWEVGQIFRGYFSESTEYLKCTRGIWGWSEPKYANISSLPPADHYGGYFFAQLWISFNESDASYKEFDYCHENTMKVWRMMVKYATHVVVEVQFWKDTQGEDIKIGDITYTNGRSYYILPISHFGDDYTPWRKGEWGTDEDNIPKAIELPYPATASERLTRERENIARSYPGCRTYLSDESVTADQEGHMSPADGNYLGRWGVVRNTWYQLNITGIKGFGLNQSPIDHPDIITHDPTPLDYYENNMLCKVRVKKWVLREQSATLQ